MGVVVRAMGKGVGGAAAEAWRRVWSDGSAGAVGTDEAVGGEVCCDLSAEGEWGWAWGCWWCWDGGL